ncbi:MAG: hypothetical protein PHW60_01250 [Kiritimatiellae bacterium]|nr:hypothetical protein [Kiritimatiellia bacterium]
MKMQNGLVLAVFLGITPCFASAAGNDCSISLLAGGLEGFGTRSSTYSWSYSYMEGLGEHLAWSISKINEGHDETHHRDGSSVQLWARTRLADRRLVLAAGFGPQFYCDTTDSDNYSGYENNHGPGLVLSIGVWYYLDPAWSLQLRSNGVLNDDDINTLSLMVGLGYDLNPTDPSNPGFDPNAIKKNEITVFLGRSIVNSFGSERALAGSLEYRRYLLPWLNVTLGGIYEGKTSMADRQGLAPQVWLGRHFSGGRLSLGVGLGPYFAYDEQRTDNPALANDFCMSALASYTAAYHFESGVLLRFTWHRVITDSDYNRDADVLLLGIGYGFN